MIKRFIPRSILLLLGAGWFCGCTKAELSYHEPGSAISFRAGGSWQTEPETRTEYSGEKVGTSPKYERINWTVNSDRIRILCSQASGGTVSDGKASDYTVKEIANVTNKTGERVSQAGISPSSGNGLRWGSSQDDHYFFALYPASGTVSGYAFGGSYRTVSESESTIAASGTSGATITGTIPSAQEVYWNSAENEFEPNMNYAYMYAWTKVDAGGAGDVSLSFEPLVTSLEFTLLAGDDAMAARELTTFKLHSGSTPLTGDFTATLTSSGLTPLESGDISNAGYDVTIDVSGTYLSETVAKKITVLTLPVTQSDLTVELTFSDNEKRTLFLKKVADGSALSVPARKKMYVSNLSVPDDIYSTYTLEVTGPTASLSGVSQQTSYTVKSCKNPNGVSEGVGWTAEFSEDGGSTWSDTAPSWLSNYTSSDASGSTTAQSYTADVSQNEAASSWHGGEMGANSTKEAAFNLCKTDYDGTATAGITTSNCYAVTRPGWYKFPAVYGNGYDNTQAYQNTNSRSYMLKDFLRHEGGTIATGGYWIQNNFIALRKDENAQVRLLWQDKNGLITTSGDNQVFSQIENTHSIGGRFIYFYVDPNSIGEGNAVIALYLKSGDNWIVVWSWHIWVVEESKLATTPVTNAAGVTKQMMITNLGWCAATEASPRSVLVRVTQDVSGKTADFTITQKGVYGKGRNLFYQWGRKDPMPGFTGNFEEPTLYEYPSYTATTTRHIHESVTPVSIGTTIQNPNVFYATTYTYDHRYDNLWNGSDDAAYDANVEVVKTVYDPCPKGFKVPNRDVYTGFVAPGAEFTPAKIGDWEQGVFFKRNVNDTDGIFFPATNLRERHTGAIRANYSGEGLYWTAAMKFSSPSATAFGGAYLQFTYLSVTPVNGAGPSAYGFAVRCIKE